MFFMQKRFSLFMKPIFPYIYLTQIILLQKVLELLQAEIKALIPLSEYPENMIFHVFM